MDYTIVFTNLKIFPTREALQEWVRQVAKEQNMVIVVKRSDKRTGKNKAHVILTYERCGEYRKFKGLDDDWQEDEKKKDKKRDTRTKKCGCPFTLKGTQVSPHDWRLEVKNGIHNHPVVIYLEGHY
ncbi:hypothetical protein ACS0TY_010297 [Phlomoides rotata]